jgi:hypothetical protein
MAVKWFTGPSAAAARDLSIRPLYVDSKLKEFTIGQPHDVTDHTFVVRRAYRINDVLPEEGAAPRWKWQRGGWLLVDRENGHLSEIKLAEFDPFYSVVSWYRDYAAYCGVSDDGEKLYAVVTEIGRKKPLVRKELGAAHGSNQPDSECPAPDWQRGPARVTFRPNGAAPLSFEVKGSSAEAEVGAGDASEAKSPDEN